MLLCALSAGIKVAGQEIHYAVPDTVKASGIPETKYIERFNCTNGIAECPDESVLERASSDDQALVDDSLHLPVLDSFGQIPLSIYPSTWAGMYDWDLHEGFNMNIGASVFACFGKNAPAGAGFSQNISAMYALPLSKRLSLAIGGFFCNTQWNSRSLNDGGLNAVLGYKFDEHWEAYFYAQKSITHKRKFPLIYGLSGHSPWLYDVSGFGDRIGAAVKYKVNPNFSFTVSLEERRY